MSPARVKVRMLRRVQHGATYHHPGEVVALDANLAREWAKGDRPAVEIIVEQPVAPGPSVGRRRADQR